MFSWSSVFSMERQLPERPSSKELVTRTLMLELSVLLKHCEKLQQDRATALRRRSSSVDYSWLASPQRLTHQLPTREILELEELCARIPPSQCGPVILRLRNLVAEFEPEVGEVSRLFRSVLCACLAKKEGASSTVWSQQHRLGWRPSRSLSLISLHSSVHFQPLWGPGAMCDGSGGLLTVEDGRMRARSLPQINVTEHREANRE